MAGPTRAQGQDILDLTITDADVAAANKDGTTGTPSLRTLGTGAQQAAPGNSLFLVPTGAIVMWHSTSATIPSGWAICDGSNGTPDLRAKFIFGATADGGAHPPAETGGATTHTHAGHSNHVFTQPDGHSAHVFTQPSAHGITQPVVANHVFTQPDGHSAHVFTQPSAHAITQPVVGNHVFTQPSAHAITQPVINNHAFTQPSAHTTHPVHYHALGMNYNAATNQLFMTDAHVFAQGASAAFTEVFHVATVAGTTSRTIGSDTGQEAVSTTGGAASLTHSAHAGGAVDAHALGTNVALTNNHSGAGVDAHSLSTSVALSNNHSGAGVNAHSAHVNGAVDAHSLSISVALSNNHAGAGVDAHSAHTGGAVDAHSAHDSPSSVPPYYALCFIMKL
jgi:hypothetical protein